MLGLMNKQSLLELDLHFPVGLYGLRNKQPFVHEFSFTIICFLLFLHHIKFSYFLLTLLCLCCLK